MLKSRVTWWNAVGLFVVAAVVAVAVQAAPAIAATPLTVTQAIGQQTGVTATVRGYVVGQPTATNTVVRSDFPSDTALALADTPSETTTSKILYVQITASFRAAYGLQANPSLMGKQLDVTGKLGTYFVHAGLTAPTLFALAGGTTPPTTSTTVVTTSTPPTGTPGDYDGTYYLPAIGKSGSALRTSLNQIIRTNTTVNYDQVWNALKVTDQDPNNSNNVILLYSGTSRAKSLNGGGVDDWNREHVWAKSHGDFGTATGPGTDLHHLRPTDVTVNSDRGNKDFDKGGTQSAEAPGNYTDADSWEPRNADKGDVARMIFYMAIRYEGNDGFPNLEVNDSTSNGTNPYIGKLSVLRQWNLDDPPSEFEKHRNQVIYDTYQHNRNPFIDHPEWVKSIWG